MHKYNGRPEGVLKGGNEEESDKAASFLKSGCGNFSSVDFFTHLSSVAV